KSIYVVNGHLVPFHYFERDFSESEFDPIREAITKILLPLATKPTIIAADFNFDNLEQRLPELFPTYKEVFSEPTTPTRGQQDHILISSHWNVESAIVKKSISDHFLCSTQITL
ncbi:MAG TPA: hypothetical protein VN711_04175, partial [Candidatus Saccharimonadales bacterium]|nr:hypothetical protein [Candidatus Saccharimonadales bacterium]